MTSSCSTSRFRYRPSIRPSRYIRPNSLRRRADGATLPRFASPTAGTTTSSIARGRAASSPTRLFRPTTASSASTSGRRRSTHQWPGPRSCCWTTIRTSTAACLAMAPIIAKSIPPTRCFPRISLSRRAASTVTRRASASSTVSSASRIRTSVHGPPPRTVSGKARISRSRTPATRLNPNGSTCLGSVTTTPSSRR